MSQTSIDDRPRAARPRLRRIGVDTGGTFTDCVLIDYDTHRITVAKVPTTPHEPQAAILAGVERLRRSSSAPEGPIESITHGTTIATNCVITGDLARVGLITTPGFRDVLEIGTQMRPALYDLHQVARAPLVPRELRVEVPGRLAADGSEVEPLDAEAVDRAVRALVEHNVDAVAIACLFSFRNGAHETTIQRLVADVAPDLYVNRASAISREPREYPRFASAAINAGLAPRVDPYIRGLEIQMRAQDARTRLYVMQSNGGLATAERSVGANVHQLILSGPAAGVIGGAREARGCGYEDCVTFDAGGTSADIGIVRDGRPRTGTEMELPNGVPCKLPHIEVETIGAGGGSIASVDAGGALTVGPASAAADPGPACYGRGGAEPTVTDAHLVLGRLSPSGLIGGDIRLDPELARRALAPIALRLGMGVERAALGVIAIMEQNLIGAIRRAAARQGEDLREFVLVAGGGAGPLHAAAIAAVLGMRAAVIPPHPGLLSALGLLDADIRHDLVEPLIGVDGADQMLERAFAELEVRATQALSGDGVLATDRRLQRFVDVRYVGQEYALTVPARNTSAADALTTFHQHHERTFGHSAPAAATELVAARIVALGLRAMPEFERALPATEATPHTRRPVHFELGQEPVDTSVYVREQLAAGQVVSGPAIVEQLDTTTLVRPGDVARVHPSGSIVIERGAR